MQRHVKYRIWKPEAKKWVSFPSKGLQSFEPIVAPVYTDCDYFIVQEYINLLDRNGKEIYEGDIVKLGLQYAETRVLAQVVHYANGFYLQAKSGGLFGDTVQHFEKCEIIGNICENPELFT